MARSPYGYFSDEDDAAEDGVWGWDDAHLVGVSLDTDGEVLEVSIATEWRSTIARDDLAHVLFASYNTAERYRLDRAQESSAKDAEDSASRTGEAPQVPASLTMQVIAVQAEYTEAYQRSLEEVREFRDDDSNVTVSARGGSVSGIEFDEQWLGFTSGPHIAAAVREPLAKAARTGREIDDHMQRQYPEVTEFRRLQSQRSAALLRR